MEPIEAAIIDSIATEIISDRNEQAIQLLTDIYDALVILNNQFYLFLNLLVCLLFIYFFYKMLSYFISV